MYINLSNLIIMKKELLLLFLVLTGIQFSYAQNEKAKSSTTSMTYVNSDAKITTFHTEEDLKKLGKIELTQLYMERVSVITENIPYIA